MTVKMEEVVAVLKDAQCFIDTLYDEYTPDIIPPNSDSGLDWDVRIQIRGILARIEEIEV